MKNPNYWGNLDCCSGTTLVNYGTMEIYINLPNHIPESETLSKTSKLTIRHVSSLNTIILTQFR